MAFRFGFGFGSYLLIFLIVLVVMPGKTVAFGAGNIPSIAQVEGHNWRHGDIEDMLKTIAFLHGKKWTTLMVQRTYFGNWLRDYSQALDVGSLKGVNAATIRILVWILSFLANGYATEEFEVTEERLGVYRPEEHIDNPLGYADGLDARTFDKRLRGPVQPIETEIDMRTGMKNYIANEHGNWATSAGYLRFSIGRSVHFGRLYCHGSHGKGKEEDLCEALRCLGQALHCMEDFSAHSNYCELALRELGYHQVFPHCGSGSEITLHGKRVFPLVTGTFGGVDFLHSVLGEANDHFTQSEVDELDVALKNSEQGASSSGGTSRGFGGGFGGGTGDFISLVSQLPGIGGGMASEARDLKRMAEDQERRNEQDSYYGTRATTNSNPNIVPGMSESFDPVKVSKQIYPILEFRDKIVKSINRGIAKIPGLEKLLEHISETLTAFVLGLLAPFIRPIINAITKALKDGSSEVINSSANSQLEPWKNPRCTDPTHSMLSKDHFTNVLNSCAGRIASTILQYVVPRVLYAWDNPGVPVDEVVNDVLRAFHHPALRDDHVEIQREMFQTVRKWADEYPRRHEINHILGSESVRTGKNHIQSGQKGHSHGGGIFDGGLEKLGHGKPSGSLWSQCATRDLNAMGAGESLRPESGYGSSRPTSSHSQGRLTSNPGYTSPGYGYTPHQPPQPLQQGDGFSPYPSYGGASTQHPSYNQPGFPQQGYGTSQGEAASYYNASRPSQGYPNQGYGGPPQQEYPPYGNQWGGGYR
ncbi:heterokaryon incompatibility Het-C [Hypoxylon trugodes]|uniref:heterokaryon incompatibility Het-C n=1 Tax=Hypoxylon trugodes TaxID=326681 RepID=UPI00219272FE|nr:heterokaryon incompatibility Het-C [Hypoxylon trugodes]KAI1389237.1 heterokaryon incompatibility Het-C [Hypoxylon trugodes]